MFRFLEIHMWYIICNAVIASCHFLRKVCRPKCLPNTDNCHMQVSGFFLFCPSKFPKIQKFPKKSELPSKSVVSQSYTCHCLLLVIFMVTPIKQTSHSPSWEAENTCAHTWSEVICMELVTYHLLKPLHGTLELRICQGHMDHFEVALSSPDHWANFPTIHCISIWQGGSWIQQCT